MLLSDHTAILMQEIAEPLRYNRMVVLDFAEAFRLSKRLSYYMWLFSFKLEGMVSLQFFYRFDPKVMLEASSCVMHSVPTIEKN